MTDWLNHPAVQAAAVPFLAAFGLAVLLRDTRLLGLAIGAAFVAVVALVMDLSFETLTASRKLVLAGLGAIVLVPLLELAKVRPRAPLRAAMASAAGLVGVWVVWRVLQRRDAVPAWPAGFAAAVYVAALVESTQALRDDAVRSSAAATALGLGCGALALFGASAILAQVGIAIAAGAGATLLLQMLRGRPAELGWTLALPASVVTALVGLLAVFTGELRWYCLLPMLAVPWAARMVPARSGPVWRTAVLSGLATLVPIALALALAWSGAASPPS